MKEKLTEEFVTNALGTCLDGKDYYIDFGDDGFVILEKDRETGEMREAHPLPCNDYPEYFPEKALKKPNKVIRWMQRVWLVILVAILMTLSIGGVLCHFGIIQ